MSTDPGGVPPGVLKFGYDPRVNWKLAVPVVAAVALAACSQAESATPGILAADPWVRATVGTEMPEMTALFVNLTNPSEEDRMLVSADCGDVAAKVELHEMVKVDGQMVMQEAEGGLPIPAGEHQHLAPGGPHVMLMGLTGELVAGGEEIECRLEFDDGQTIDLVAPVKEFTEEQDTYHTHAPTEDS
ncbi:copper chaperone PCu(A)C [Tessaracoccus sp. MC1679]|nr:copper chaperone PCu(A)C [Tessaracoccus sp. MC1679]MBB1515400.1 copper chaperone PCu(A)C [Tessaracoccus sp. MC1679]